ncbi:MAG TPA: hypothetical protein VGU74_03290 [Gemmatimonadales bacterium]|nr:hypothetical protein [Gemmatimonadales bacterium]
MRLVPLPAAVALLASIVACSDAFQPSVDNVAGDYQVYAFTTVDTAGKKVDWFAAGATLALTLNKDGTTAGQLHIPHYHFGGGDLYADMAGTWTLSGDTITFAQAADTFMRDMPFFAGRNALRGNASFADATVRILLLK